MARRAAQLGSRHRKSAGVRVEELRRRAAPFRGQSLGAASQEATHSCPVPLRLRRLCELACAVMSWPVGSGFEQCLPILGGPWISFKIMGLYMNQFFLGYTSPTITNIQSNIWRSRYRFGPMPTVPMLCELACAV
jgi:hypothetical protein